MSKGKPQITNWKENRRFHALRLKKQKWRQSEIATALNVSKSAVSRWVKQAKVEGKNSLKAKPRTGRPPELTEEQKLELPDLLWHGAESYGFRGDVWTCPRIKKVIEREFGVVYHRSHVARIMKELEWTPQQPIEKAIQRNEVEIARWRKKIWFEIRKRAVLERRVLVFVDESGFYLLPAILKTYAPRGQTPILNVFQTRDHLSVMSGVTPQGWFFSKTCYNALNGSDSVWFLKHLRSQTEQKLLVIWDGSPIHRNTEVRDYLANGGAKHVHLERLPAYAPELNPDEGAWRHLKRVELANLCCKDLDDLHKQLLLAICRLRRRPSLIQSFSAQAGLPL
ncbi:MAG: IS630 family transposase ISDge17 [Anaerolineales bacterium]|nr:IS630 family transposase ISDge17 [Anaerolineales bacterium]